MLYRPLVEALFERVGFGEGFNQCMGYGGRN